MLERSVITIFRDESVYPFQGLLRDIHCSRKQDGEAIGRPAVNSYGLRDRLLFKPTKWLKLLSQPARSPQHRSQAPPGYTVDGRQLFPLRIMEGLTGGSTSIGFPWDLD